MSNLVLTRNGHLAKRNRSTMDPFTGLNDLFSEIWNQDLPKVYASNFNHGMTMPKVNILENENSFEVQMAVPGFKKADFNISVEDDELLIAAEIKESKEEEEKNFTRREFGYASFQRTFILPETVEGEKIEANYKEGILNISIPKKEEAKPKPARTIKIS